MTRKVLIADDDPSIRLVLSRALGDEGFEVRATGNIATLGKWIRDGEGDAVITDVMMDDGNVLDRLGGFVADRPGLPVIVISGRRTVETALGAARGGAFQYFPKPFDLDELLATLRRALAIESPGMVKARARFWHADPAAPEVRAPVPSLVGRSEAMQAVYRGLAWAIASDLPVMLEGEAGTGKDLAARYIHSMGRRRSGPMVVLDIAGLSSERVEEVLHGHDGRPGALEQARGGSLHFRGCEAAPAGVLTRLSGLCDRGHGAGAPDLRLTFGFRSGQASHPLVVNARDELGAIHIRLPSVRERREDIADLLRALLVRYQRPNEPAKAFLPDALDVVCAHPLPANVRTLSHLVRRLLVECPGPGFGAREVIERLPPVRDDIPAAPPEPLTSTSPSPPATQPITPPAPAPSIETMVDGLLSDRDAHGAVYDRALEAFERPLIVRAMRLTKGNQIRAAAMLGLNRNTLRKKIQMLGLKVGED
jgi:two-component system nitrogen regulation response regulator GlnG